MLVTPDSSQWHKLDERYPPVYVPAKPTTDMVVLEHHPDVYKSRIWWLSANSDLWLGGVQKRNQPFIETRAGYLADIEKEIHALMKEQKIFFVEPLEAARLNKQDTIFCANPEMIVWHKGRMVKFSEVDYAV